jgi:hypothetical protein
MSDIHKPNSDDLSNDKDANEESSHSLGEDINTSAEITIYFQIQNVLSGIIGEIDHDMKTYKAFIPEFIWQWQKVIYFIRQKTYSQSSIYDIYHYINLVETLHNTMRMIIIGSLLLVSPGWWTIMSIVYFTKIRIPQIQKYIKLENTALKHIDNHHKNIIYKKWMTLKQAKKILPLIRRDKHIRAQALPNIIWDSHLQYQHIIYETLWSIRSILENPKSLTKKTIQTTLLENLHTLSITMAKIWSIWYIIRPIKPPMTGTATLLWLLAVEYQNKWPVYTRITQIYDRLQYEEALHKEQKS